MTSRFAALAVDALRPRMVADFWCAVLGWNVVEVEGRDVRIGPADGSRAPIDFLAVPENDAKQVKNRLHIDLRADGTSTADELQRLLDLGARRVDVGQGPDVTWTVLADPEGNEFCLLSRTAQEVDEENEA